MTTRVLSVLMTLPGVTCSALTAGTLATNPFETMQGVTHWSMSAEAKLSLETAVFKGGLHALRIDYALPTKKSQVTVGVAGSLERVPTRISLWVYGDGSRNLHGIRLKDRSGETHYYRLGLLPGRGWTRCVVELANWGRHYHAWGGNGDKKIDLPIADVSYDIRSYSAYGKCAVKGSVVIDDLSVEGPAPKEESRPAGIGEATANTGEVPRFGKFELCLKLGVECKNPYDPDEVLLRARFTSPSGKTTEVDGFHIAPYRVAFRRVESLAKHGDAHWRVRFTPTVVGTYRYVLTLRDSSGTHHPPRSGQFECVPSRSNGFLRVSPTDRYYLQFDSGEPLIGIGVGGHLWGADRPGCLRKYRSWLSDLAAFGGNCISVTFETLGAGTFGLDYRAPLGANYDQENAARLDYVLDMAERRGVYLVVNLFQTALFQAKHWERSRFSKKRGGPCGAAAEFFSHPRAMGFQKQLLRYLIARWGYSPNVLIWELCNEVNYSEASKKRPEDVRQWHREMGAYLRKIDPNRHLISTSFGSGEACEDPAVWALPEIDSTIIHTYANDTVQTLWRRLGIKRTYGKPCLGGEVGIHFPIVDKAYEIDPDGLHFHNSHWASILSGGAGNVLHWWASRYWDSQDLPRLFRPLAGFCKGIDWPREGFQRIELEASRADVPDAGLADVIHDTSVSWQQPTLTEFHFSGSDIISFREKRHIDDDPKVNVSRLPCGLLFGATQPDRKRPVRLVFDSPAATRARIVLGAVAQQGATLEISGPRAPQKLELADRDGADDPYADELQRTIDLKLPAGKSEWRVANTGQSWCTIKRIHIERFTRADRLEQLLVIGLRGRRVSLLWFYDTHSNWYQQSIGKEIKPFEGIVAKLPVTDEGTFRVEWWDTWRGRTIRQETIASHESSLRLVPPRFVRDIACRAWKLTGGAH